MCTIIGILNFNKEIKIIFIHNRDKPIEGFKGHELRIFNKNNNKVIGIYDYRSKGIACGFEIKNKIFGGITNILGYFGKKSRGVLLLNSLLNSKSLEDVLNYILKEIKTGDYSPANYLIGNEEKMYVIENFKEKFKIYQTNKVVLTNYFKFLNEGKLKEEDIKRKKFVEEKIKKINDLNKIIKIPVLHKPVSVCRHNITLSSFILIAKNKESKIFYSLSKPCEGYKEKLFL